jgi:tRNA 2-thiouridine synthesizing protein B
VILHTLNASPASASFADCLSLLAPGDALLLHGDGVYAALAGTSAAKSLLASCAALYILVDDARAAGVLDRAIPLTAVDINDFVALTERFPRQLAWY